MNAEQEKMLNRWMAKWGMSEYTSAAVSLAELRGIIERILAASTPEPSVEKEAYKIAIDFSERFQKNYPAEPLWKMMDALAKEIQGLVSASPHTVKLPSDEELYAIALRCSDPVEDSVERGIAMLYAHEAAQEVIIRVRELNDEEGK